MSTGNTKNPYFHILLLYYDKNYDYTDNNNNNNISSSHNEINDKNTKSQLFTYSLFLIVILYNLRLDPYQISSSVPWIQEIIRIQRIFITHRIARLVVFSEILCLNCLINSLFFSYSK